VAEKLQPILDLTFINNIYLTRHAEITFPGLEKRHSSERSSQEDTVSAGPRDCCSRRRHERDVRQTCSRLAREQRIGKTPKRYHERIAQFLMIDFTAPGDTSRVTRLQQIAPVRDIVYLASIIVSTARASSAQVRCGSIIAAIDRAEVALKERPMNRKLPSRRPFPARSTNARSRGLDIETTVNDVRFSSTLSSRAFTASLASIYRAHESSIS